MATEQNKDNKRVEERKTTTNKYPHEKVWVSQGGIKYTYGNEKGKEFIRMEHPSGHATEVYPDGKVITMHIGDNKQYNKAGVTISVDENNDVHIHGHQNIKVGGGSHIEVVGNAGVAVGGDIALVGMKNFNFDVQNCYMGIRGDFGMKVEGGATFDIVGDALFKTGAEMNMEHGGARTDTSPNHTIETSDHTISSPITNVTGDIDHGGNMTTGGVHVDSLGTHR